MSEFSVEPWIVDPNDPNDVATLQSEFCAQQGLLDAYMQDTLEPGQIHQAARRVTRLVNHARGNQEQINASGLLGQLPPVSPLTNPETRL